jgi:hypothetical protein
MLSSFGFTSEQAALLSIPSGVIAIICISGASYTSSKFNIRFVNIVALLLPGIIGGALMAFLPDQSRAGKLIGNYLTNTVGASASSRAFECP